MKKVIFILFFSLTSFLACSLPKAENLLEVSVTKTEYNLNLQKVETDVNQSNNRRTDSSVTKIKSSILSDLLEKKKKANPKISSKELADFANDLIPKYGVNFWVDLADLIEKKTKAKEIKELSDDNVRFSFRLNLSDATQKTFQIDSPTDSCCCGYAYADFPVSNITDKQMTVIVDGKPYKIKRTKDISFSQEYILLDDETKTKKIRSWQVPVETSPFGISGDGTKLYIEDDSDLLLEISEDGNIKFVPKNLPQIITNGKDLREFPEPKIGEILYKSGENGLMLFKSKTKNYIVDFPYVCS